MRLSIRHTSHYRFDEPVIHALQRLRLTPKTTQGQQILKWHMEYKNAAPELQYEDQHHNTVTLVAVTEGAQEVIVECSGTVETEDNAGVIGRHAGHLPLWSFLGQTRLTKPGPTVERLVGNLPQDDDAVTVLHNLSAAIRDTVEYKTGTTRVDTTGEEAATSGAGVCQDHSHIFIGAARHLGYPARYVSGYLMMNDRIEQEATHGWAEAFVEGLGWVGFDISNGISPDTRYVRVATGRDYRDAAPITGISFGTANEELQVDVAVEQQQVEQ
ncbi:transglutaminase family protein [Altererythrobacter aurantiacus]|uniref:Transglutaminase family protein n=1 Tax=Parapontixanthobacter aurantiacus TaxID=1463599 RepID=A0A844ZE31_9SPHN|nr:transglutaminase family protein [Parapontixanthobacter aurantiacus]MXO85784.1 transglutaminase family protein [Parapontixanthobacter aurantiacus]